MLDGPGPYRAVRVMEIVCARSAFRTTGLPEKSRRHAAQCRRRGAE